MLLDASDQGIAHDLGVNYAPKLGNLAIGDPEAVQTVTLESPTPDQNRFGQAVVNFQGAPDFSPTRIAEPGPDRLPARELPAGRGRRPRATARSSGSPARRPSTARRSSPPATARSTSSTTRTPATACSASTSPGRRRPASYAESWVDLLFVKGFDAGQPIVYISTDAGQPLTAVLERSTYVPALDKARLQRRRRLPRLRPRAAVRLHQRPDRRRTTRSRRASSTCQGRPRLRGRQRGQHRADRRAPQRRRPAERVRRLPDLRRIRATRRPTARSGTPSSGSGRTRRSSRA